MTIGETARPEVWRIALEVTGAALDAATEALDEFAGAISVFLADPKSEPGPDAIWSLVAHAKLPPDRAALEARFALIAAAWDIAPPALIIERLADEDWVARNLRSFPPIDAGRFRVLGSHIREGARAGRIALVVDAGAAFGSGEHATTHGCLLALDGLLRRRRFRNVLDLGCGTAILGIAAAKAGCARVLAADIDADAVRIAAFNARRNGAAARLRAIRADGYRRLAIRRRAPFDLVLANILAGPLARLAPGLARALAPGGIAVLAGLLDRQERWLLAAHRAQRLRLAGRIRLDGWTVLVLAKA